MKNHYEEYVTLLIDIQKLIINTRKIMIKMKNHSLYLKYWSVNNFYGWAMPQKFPVNEFKWIEDLLNLTKIS